jgi:hypothetical protein
MMCADREHEDATQDRPCLVEGAGGEAALGQAIPVRGDVVASQSSDALGCPA